MPDALPPWAEEFAELYFAGTTCVFVLHGNVHDLIRQGPADRPRYAGIPEFLATQLFGSWDVVLRYDLSQGLEVYAGSDGDRLRKMVALVERANRRAQDLAARSRRGSRVCLIILIQKILMEADRVQADQLGRDLRSRPVPAAHGRVEPDGRPRRARGWCGCFRGPRTLTSSGTTSRSACSATRSPRSTSGWSAARTWQRWRFRCPTPRPARSSSTWFDSQRRQARQPDRFHPDAARRADQRAEPGQPGAAAGPGRPSRAKSSTPRRSSSSRKG